jgi:hypothetical protein
MKEKINKNLHEKHELKRRNSIKNAYDRLEADFDSTNIYMA